MRNLDTLQNSQQEMGTFTYTNLSERNYFLRSLLTFGQAGLKLKELRTPGNIISPVWLLAILQPASAEHLVRHPSQPTLTDPYSACPESKMALALLIVCFLQKVFFELHAFTS